MFKPIKILAMYRLQAVNGARPERDHGLIS
jgi:hypothetical protein